jgi:hypothetical protein
MGRAIEFVAKQQILESVRYYEMSTKNCVQIPATM